MERTDGMGEGTVNTVTLTIDGIEVTVPQGTLVVDAARKAGIEIPVFCSHPMLEPIGACRMCLVRVEKIPKLITSCTLPVADGMVVTTNSEEVAAARAGVLEFLLSNHSLDCPFCDKGGECDLQDHTFRHGVPAGRFEEQKILRQKKLVPPIIEKVMSRCVQCARCIRYCDEIMGVGALRFINRGVRAEPGAFMDGALECELCGNCIEVCPVGALTSEFYDLKARPGDRKSTTSVCTYCGDGCTVVLEAKGRHSNEMHVIRARGIPGKGVNDDFLCVRGRFGYGVVNSTERLKQPLIRRDGQLVPATWDEALEHVATRLREIRDQHGPGAIGGIGSQRCTNEEAYLFGKLLRGVLGTNHIDCRTEAKRAFQASTLARLLALAPVEGALRRLRTARLVVLVGSDATSENPWCEKQILQAVRKDRQRLLLAYPRRIRLVEHAAQWLRHAPGAEPDLLRGLAALAANEAEPGEVAASTGVAAGEVAAFAKEMQEAGDVVIVLGPGVFAGANPEGAMTAAVELVRALAGRRSGAGQPRRADVVVQAPYNNTRGAQDMGLLPDTYPGYAGMDVTGFGEWGDELPRTPGMSTGEMLAAEEGTLKALYIMGANPAVAFPDGHLAVGALRRVEFLVVQDLFLTPTAREADVVLPAASFAEKDGTFTSLEGRVQRVRRAIDPPGQARADWEILTDLAVRLGAPWSYLSPAEIAREIARLVPLYAPLNYVVLDLPVSNLMVRVEDRSETIGPGAGPEGGARRGRAQGGGPSGDYPFVVMVGEMLFHSGTLSPWADEMRRLAPHSYVEIAAEDAARLGIADGERVRLVSPGGELSLCAHVQPNGTPGILFLPRHFAESPANALLRREAGVDRVRVEKE